MIMRELGKSGIQASAISLGTWAIGGGPWWGDSDDQLSISAIHAAMDQGVNLIDTAPAYGFGHSEEVVGRAVADRRDKAILATKCGLWWEDDTGVVFFELGDKVVKRTLRPDTIRRELEFSLKRMGTDYIDLYQTHWPALAPEETIADTMACLLDLKKEGKIRAIGASNVDIPMIEQYLAAGTLDAVQPKYSMLDRAIEADLLPFCLEKGISTLAYSPLEQGLLTGKITRDQTFGDDEFRNNIPWFSPDNRPKVLDMLDGWQDLTDKYDCNLSQLVIAWTVAQPGLTFALCGARKPEHSRENAAAGTLELDAADITRIRTDVEALGAPVTAEE